MSIDNFVAGDKIDLDNEIPDGQDPLEDAIEAGNEFEGDIVLTPEQTSVIINGTEDEVIAMRSARKSKHWPKQGSKVYIPYKIRPGSNYGTKERQRLARAISEYERNTCIR